MDRLDGGNQTILMCPQAIDRHIHNLTSSYTEKSNEASMVSASVIMFVLAGLFFNLNLFSGISDVSATLDPKVRLFLSSALSLLLPVMSYLFSEAKNAASAAASASAWRHPRGRRRALAGRRTHPGVDAAGGAAPQEGGRDPHARLLRHHPARRPRRLARQPRLLQHQDRRPQGRLRHPLDPLRHQGAAEDRLHRDRKELVRPRQERPPHHSYMAKTMRRPRQQSARRDDDDVEQAVHQQFLQGGAAAAHEQLKSCSYIVMGEERLVKEATADGYELNDDELGSVITGLGLSFALFKLLRRKFERLPAVTADEAQDCRSLVVNGLQLRHSNDGGAEELFRVVNDEVVFLSEYYHSVVPVVLASPFFLLANYFLVLAVVAVLCLMTVILCGNGDAVYAFRSVGADNYTFHTGIGRIAVCLLLKARHSPEAFFSIVDLSITALLFVIYFYEEVWEFFVFLLSNWFMVSLVCNYIAKPHWRRGPYVRWAFQRIIWLRSKLNHGSLSFRQFSVLKLRWPLGLSFYSTLSLLLSKEPVPRNLKQSIVDYLLDHDHDPLTNGKSALEKNYLSDKLSWACKSDSVSEVLLTWHIATCILEVECSQQAAAAWSRTTAVRLSNYCAYLVAFHPELLPDNPEKAERVVQGMKAELGGIFRCWEYYLYSHRARVKKIKEAVAAGEKKNEQSSGGVVRDGAKLAGLLLDEARSNGDQTVWKVLADVWTELIVFVAPSRDEKLLKGHEDVLVHGGEFITVLWALATHIGVSREAGKPEKTLEDLIAESMRRVAA
ncbi:hypothetical protein BS78_10G014800 [Paspalum vaginatum]|nr:hypothetical protein BS78_10G014800 [Paspalum vaginatum]